MNVLLDLDILKLFLNKDLFYTYKGLVNPKILSEEARTLLVGYRKYYETHSVEDIDLLSFYSWFVNTLHREFMPDTQIQYKLIIDRIIQTENIEVASLLTRLKQELAWAKLQEHYSNGFDVEKMKQELDELESALPAIGDNVDSNLCSMYFHEDVAVPTGGLKWRLKHLNTYMGSPSGFGAVYAYTNTGKSAFLSSEATYIAQQLNEGETVLYFNNEGSDKKIVNRLWQSCLAADKDTIVRDLDRSKKIYLDKMGGDINRIRVINITHKNLAYIEQQCKLYKPKLIIIDQIDKILTDKEQLQPRPYEALYAHIRDLSVEYAPVLGATQGPGNSSWLDAATQEVQYQKWLGATQLHWSKVDKQANCDYLIAIGMDTKTPNQRYIWLPRCKDGEEGVNTRFVCTFNRETQLYGD